MMESIQAGLKLAAPLGTLIVGFAVAYVAWQQWKTAHEKLRLELFEKRYKVYQAVIDFIIEASWNTIGQQQVFMLDSARNEAFFLFGRDKVILDYLKALRERAHLQSSLQTQADEISGPPNEQRTALVMQTLEIKEWFSKQPEVARDKFSVYLSFYAKS